MGWIGLDWVGLDWMDKLFRLFVPFLFFFFSTAYFTFLFNDRIKITGPRRRHVLLGVMHENGDGVPQAEPRRGLVPPRRSPGPRVSQSVSQSVSHKSVSQSVSQSISQAVH